MSTPPSRSGSIGRHRDRSRPERATELDGRAGQRISARFAAAPTSTISILKPDSTALGGTSYIGACGGFVDTRTLPVDGTSRWSPTRGRHHRHPTVRLFDVPADATATLAANDSTQLMTLATPQQNEHFTLAGRAGERLSVKLCGSTIRVRSSRSWSRTGARSAAARPSEPPRDSSIRARCPGQRVLVLVDPQGAATASSPSPPYDVPADVQERRAGSRAAERDYPYARPEPRA